MKHQERVRQAVSTSRAPNLYLVWRFGLHRCEDHIHGWIANDFVEDPTMLERPKIEPEHRDWWMAWAKSFKPNNAPTLEQPLDMTEFDQDAAQRVDMHATQPIPVLR